MKIAWEASDIRGGSVVGRKGRDERWMIGYQPGRDNPETRWVLVSLADGCISAGPASAEIIADALTKNGDIPIELI